jgi:hypothetical protein
MKPSAGAPSDSIQLAGAESVYAFSPTLPHRTNIMVEDKRFKQAPVPSSHSRWHRPPTPTSASPRPSPPTRSQCAAPCRTRSRPRSARPARARTSTSSGPARGRPSFAPVSRTYQPCRVSGSLRHAQGRAGDCGRTSDDGDTGAREDVVLPACTALVLGRVRRAARRRVDAEYASGLRFHPCSSSTETSLVAP